MDIEINLNAQYNIKDISSKVSSEISKFNLEDDIKNIESVKTFNGKRKNTSLTTEIIQIGDIEIDVSKLSSEYSSKKTNSYDVKQLDEILKALEIKKTKMKKLEKIEAIKDYLNKKNLL